MLPSCRVFFSFYFSCWDTVTCCFPLKWLFWIYLIRCCDMGLGMICPRVGSRIPSSPAEVFFSREFYRKPRNNKNKKVFPLENKQNTDSNKLTQQVSVLEICFILFALQNLRSKKQAIATPQFCRRLSASSETDLSAQFFFLHFFQPLRHFVKHKHCIGRSNDFSMAPALTDPAEYPAPSAKAQSNLVAPEPGTHSLHALKTQRQTKLTHGYLSRTLPWP